MASCSNSVYLGLNEKERYIVREKHNIPLLFINEFWPYDAR